MKCAIPSPNVKILARAIHSLAKIGDELFVEFSKDGVEFRTLNMAKSAYSTFTFRRSFFSSFNNIDSSQIYKISVKSCLTVFKTPHGTDKHVESCQLCLNEDNTQLVFLIRYSIGHTKTHFLPILGNEDIKVNYKKEDLKNSFVIMSKFLNGAVKHFRLQEDEITFLVSVQQMHLRNYLSNREESRKATIRTEICLLPEDFELYSVKKLGKITFSLRELRAVLAFSEVANFPVRIYFDESGSPVIFQVGNDDVYEATYFLSTLPPTENVEDNVLENDEIERLQHILLSTSTTDRREIPGADTVFAYDSDGLVDSD